MSILDQSKDPKVVLTTLHKRVTRELIRLLDLAISLLGGWSALDEMEMRALRDGIHVEGAPQARIL